MNKQEFLTELDRHLKGLPKKERDEQIKFYSEIIDDRIEEGESEEEAISAIGGINDITDKIISEASLGSIVKEKFKNKAPRKTWQTVLIIAGSPVWGAILISIFAVVFSLYVSCWAIIVSLWATVGALVGAALGGILGGMLFIFTSKITSGIFLIACAFVCVGIVMIIYYAILFITKEFAKFTKTMMINLKFAMVGKERKL